jgi:hypothetical protein
MVEADGFSGEMPLEGPCSSSTSHPEIETEVFLDTDYDKTHRALSGISTGNSMTSTDYVS